MTDEELRAIEKRLIIGQPAIGDAAALAVEVRRLKSRNREFRRQLAQMVVAWRQGASKKQAALTLENLLVRFPK